MIGKLDDIRKTDEVDSIYHESQRIAKSGIPDQSAGIQDQHSQQSCITVGKQFKIQISILVFEYRINDGIKINDTIDGSIQTIDKIRVLHENIRHHQYRGDRPHNGKNGLYRQ